MNKSSFLKNNIFNYFNVIFLGALGLLCLLPFIHVIAKSLSDQGAVLSGQVGLIPIGTHFNNYLQVIFEPRFLNAFTISVFVTVVGTFASMLITVLAAYPLSKPEFRGRKIFMLMYVFAMVFYGGMVPNFMLMQFIGLIDTVWAMIIPFLVIPFNLFVVKTFFEGMPTSIEESAKIDGASNIRILFSIILPISLPVLATISLFYAVTYWNSYFHAMLFITSQELKPLQVFLLEMIQGTDEISRMNAEENVNFAPEGIRSTTVILAALPIILIYPFLQKHFTKGLTLGSTK